MAEPPAGAFTWSLASKVRVGTTPAEDAESRRKEAEKQAAEAKRQADIQEEARAQKARVGAREGELNHIRERFMFNLLPQCARGLHPGDDTHEAMLILQIVERIDGLIAHCNGRRMVIDQGMEKVYVEGSTPLRLEELMGKPKGAEKGSK